MAKLSDYPPPAIRQKLGAVIHSRRARRWSLAVLLFVALFGIAGFFIAPPLIKNAAEEQLSRQLGRPASIGRIALNPYLLRLEADDIHIGGRGEGESFVDVGQLVVRVSWTSLVRFAPIVAELRVVRPRISIIRHDAEHFNFSDLTASPEPAPAKDDGPLPRFAVSNIQIADGRISFDDKVLNVQHVIDQLSIDLPFIATLPQTVDVFVEPRLRALIDGNPVALDAKTKPLAQTRDSSVSVTLEQIDIPDLLSYVPVALPVLVKEGKLSGDILVNFALDGGKPALGLSGNLVLAGTEVATKAGAPLFAAQALKIEARRIEPLAGIVHLADITVEQPVISLARDQDGQLNMLQLAAAQDGAPAPVPEASTTDPAAAPAESAAGQAVPFDLAIDRFAIDNGTVRLDDASVTPPAALALTRIVALAGGFTLSGPTPASFSLSSEVASGGAIRAEGAFTLAAKQAQAKLAIDSLALAPLQPYLAQASAARIAGGTLSIAIGASTDWSKTPLDLVVSDSSVSLKTLQVALPGAPSPAIALADGSVTVSRIDLAAQTAEIAGIEAKGLAIDAVRQANGQIDLAALAAPPGKAQAQSRQRPAPRPAVKPASKPASKPAASAAPETPAPWRYRIAELALKDARVSFTDRTVRRPVKLEVAPLAFSVQQITEDLSKPVPVKLAATVNGKGTLALTGNVAPDPLKLDLKLNGERVDVAAFEPYFGDALNARIASAFLNAKGDVAFEQARRGMRASYRGELTLVDVRMLDGVSSDPLAGWRSLALNGLKAAYDEAKGIDVETARVTFSNFFGHVLLDAEGQLRLKDVIAREDGKGDAQPAPAPAPAPAVTAGEEEAKPPMRLRFGQLQLQNGRVTYTDNFIRPNYSANLVAINGTVGTFGTDSTVAAPVDISAQLKANGPISIKGEVNPLAGTPSLDLTAVAKDIELTNLTAYSTKYAGYPITKGKLNVDLHYQLADDRLSANNHIFIDQFTFGERVENDTATQLPVRLAIALLKNAQGQIDVNVPVSGSLSDPQFSVGSLIWHAFLNLLTKAVTSPFTLLASVFGGDGAELGYVEFPPGSADLSEAASQKLDTIAKMLADKPSVSLDLIGRADPATDPEGLRTVHVQELVRKQKVKAVTGRGKSVDPAEVTVEPAEYSKYLTEAYRAADFERPRNLVGMLKSLPDAEMEKALADHAPVAESSLDGLARERAQAVRQYLQGKVDEKRVFVVAPKLDANGIDDKGLPNRVDFSLR